MAYWQITLDCLEQHTELLEEFFFVCDALSVSFEDAGDMPIFEPKPGTTPLWAQTKMIVLFAEDHDITDITDQLRQNYANFFTTIHIEKIEEKNWLKECLQDFMPIKISDNIWICPSWLEAPSPDVINIILDPGVAFGTGSHPTTFLCLHRLEQENPQDKTVIDYGCGSGILAIAAAKLQAKTVIAVDISEQALEATQSNAKINHMTNITTYYPENLPAIKADIIVANILLEPLLQLKSDFADLLVDNGILIVSGILIEQIPDLINHYDNFTVLDSTIKEEWACVTFMC